MKGKKHKPEQIIKKLCEADAMIMNGLAMDMLISTSNQAARRS